MAGRSNGAIKVFLDNNLVLEESKNQRTRNVSADFNFEKGKTYNLRVEYIENNNHYASAKLFWNPPNAQEILRKDALSKANQADVVIMVMGINPSVEGEEMDVKNRRIPRRRPNRYCVAETTRRSDQSHSRTWQTRCFGHNGR